MADAKEEKKAKEGTSYVVSSVDRAIEILLTLAERPETGVTELAEATGNTKSLTFRLLHTLERRGMVRKDPDRRSYTLGYRALLLGDQSRRQSRLVSTAEPILSNLSAATRENALLLVREDLHSICIAMHASPEPLRIFAAVGRLGPLHAGGGPKVLLAWAPCEVRDKVISGALETYTDMSISDAETLEARLASIREAGHAISVGELDPNIFSIAAPVRDHTGAVIAALGVNGPNARLDDRVQESITSAVLFNAEKLSRMLGWHGDSTISGG
ncbi:MULTISPECIES: IclR family transcriptional regulator [Marivita]|jgi:IclR family KDG regulon transcriptional repressor|uniref:IclR family transcriptional regulator n=2 Tax=Marivita cryptomonadis TaxID=505252 RepID=A0A9Q2RZN4_9RHOB|nr:MULTISPECIES: IclR family transcriptional regulator [Marivita]MCR9169311.1 IclR family transcriptional regulator [Paracoccaceae bacterium]MBM2324040.1 IclR family transcriptional regulator [Marivita cryptomonadis]MBM2333630.1 IclR family transcriptional regulator [Marivita cryptomonadis]MBM2343207.1 IclR family transcriptional regulator [Marivita cryptomonadis]MBM2347879.1 IclR family transcriptional regulator [Marivita cryptomonadis]